MCAPADAVDCNDSSYLMVGDDGTFYGGWQFYCFIAVLVYPIGIPVA